MIQRFNFYDVYGYLVPGMVLIGVFWLPFGLVFKRVPDAGWSSAFVGLACAYVAGHVLQSLAKFALPHGRRLPSDVLLDRDDPILPGPLKNRLYYLIQHQYRIDVEPDKKPDVKPESPRKDAFLLCREALIRSGGASYAEQFQGMYALMRGVAAALILGAAYHFGWGLGSLLSSQWWPFGVPGMGILLAAMVLLALRDFLKDLEPQDRRTRLLWDGWWLWLATGVSFFLGGMLGSQHSQASAVAVSMAGIFLGDLLVIYRCYRGYREFAKQFAASVYRGFVELHAPPPTVERPGMRALRGMKSIRPTR